MLLLTGSTKRLLPERLLRAAALLFSGLFAGFVLAVLVLEQSLRSYDGPVYTQVRQVELDALDKLAGATLIPAILLTTALLVLTFRAGIRGPARWSATAALTLMIGVFLLTLAVNLPINADQSDWSVQNPPTDWADVRDRWQLSHAARTLAALAAFALLAVGTLTPTANPPGTENTRAQTGA